MPVQKKEKATKVLFVKQIPLALHNAFAARARLHGKSIKQRIIELMRKDIKPTKEQGE